MYPPPRNSVLRWFAEIGSDLPDDLQQRLRSTFFTSSTPLIVGSINTIAVSSVAYFRSAEALFAIIAMLDMLLLGLRVTLLRRVHSPSDFIFVTGLLWACLQGATIIIVVSSNDVAMSIVVLASALAAIGGIIGRNFAAGRYAMTQIFIIDLSYKLTFSIVNPEFIPLICIQTLAFFLMNLGLIRQHRAAAIQAIQSEFASRDASVRDHLTRLINRRGLEEAFEKLVGQGKALLYLDLDGFKQVNDRLGHAAGDTLLREAGRRLHDLVEPYGTACRLGGDEFLLLVRDLANNEVQLFGDKIVETVGNPYDIGDGVFAKIGVSIGVARDEHGVSQLTTLMARADQALYAAKTAGKGCCILSKNIDAQARQAA